MEKKRKAFTVQLDIEDTVYVQEYLAKKGMTLSGFVRASIAEFKENIMTGGEIKSLEEMSAVELLKTVEGFLREMREKDIEGREKEIEEKLKD